MAEHKPVYAVSGVVKCSCGFDSGHFAHMDDAWDKYDEHLEKEPEDASTQEAP